MRLQSSVAPIMYIYVSHMFIFHDGPPGVVVAFFQAVAFVCLPEPALHASLALLGARRGSHSDRASGHTGKRLRGS